MPSARIEVCKTVNLRRSVDFKSKDILHQKYIIERLSTDEIAKQIGTARSTILKYLKIHGIPVRGTGQSIRKRAGYGLSYGRRIVNRQEVANKREQDYIAKLKDLRQQGFSYWKIADIFNTLKVPTKTGRGRWHARSVQQILDANC